MHGHGPGRYIRLYARHIWMLSVTGSVSFSTTSRAGSGGVILYHSLDGFSFPSVAVFNQCHSTYLASLF